jgi:hypothetical protein
MKATLYSIQFKVDDVSARNAVHIVEANITASAALAMFAITLVTAWMPGQKW